MKLGPLTKIGKKNRATSKNFDHDVVLVNCEVTVFFFSNLWLIWSNPEAAFQTQGL